MWVKDLDLRQIDKNVIAGKTGMLTDRPKYAAHKLLHQQFPDIEGCHSTLLAQSFSLQSIVANLLVC